MQPFGLGRNVGDDNKRANEHKIDKNKITIIVRTIDKITIS